MYIINILYIYYMGAGIIPIALYNGTLFVLLGKERYKENYQYVWCDFGGSVDKKNKSEIYNPYYTAIREGTEELNGLFGNFNILKRKVDDNYISNFSNTDNTYHSFLFNVHYDTNLPIYFKNQNKFIEEHLSDIVSHNNGLFEKTEIKWFTIKQLNNLVNKNKSPIRKHFVSIVKQIIKNHQNIIHEIS